jgi:hypothetical protein
MEISQRNPFQLIDGNNSFKTKSKKETKDSMTVMCHQNSGPSHLGKICSKITMRGLKSHIGLNHIYLCNV